MPQPPHSAVSVGKGVNQLQLIVEYAAFYQHMHFAFLHPFQQLPGQAGGIIRKGAKVEDIALPVHHPHRPGAEAAGFLG